MAVIGRRTTLHGRASVRRLEFRCLTCGAHFHADEDAFITHGYMVDHKPYVLTFCDCDTDLLVPVTMLRSEP